VEEQRSERLSGYRRPVLVAAILVAAATMALAATALGQPDGNKSHGPSGPKAKNVIVFVGDGMAQAQRDAIRYSTVGLEGELAMDSLPYAGVLHTSPADPEEFVTDSAAAGTAIATGVKTYNGAVGVDANGRPVESVLEDARRAGKATGLVTSSQVTDATPAAFGAHVADRSEQSEIARQYLEHSKPDVILGGGEDYWYPAGNPGAYPDNPPEDPTEASKGTEGNLVQQAEQRGYEYVTNAEELEAARGPKILGLFANEEMFQQNPEGEGDIYDPVVPLPQMTQKALDTLSKNKKKGFFLVVEEEAIDEMGHRNNASLVLKSGQALDEAVAVANAYAKKNRDTLVVTLGDHEAGGLTVEGTDTSDESGDGISAEDGPFPVANSDKEFVMDWTTTAHTAVSVPLTAGGPGARLFAGVYENTYVHDALARAAGVRSR